MSLQTPEQATIEQILKQRNKTHGEFRDNSKISRTLRQIVIAEITERGEVLEAYQEEAIFMVCHKLARIACGNNKLADHWRDIGGYGKITADRLEEDYPEDQ